MKELVFIRKTCMCVYGWGFGRNTLDSRSFFCSRGVWGSLFFFIVSICLVFEFLFLIFVYGVGLVG